MDSNNNILKELQKIELEMLSDFIKVCDKLKINYFLTGGTLIGAVRHKGFIPWDDDIDICMLRSDYELFLKNGQKYLDKKYFLQTYETDNEYPHCFAKIRNNKTTFLETSVSDKKINHGVFIDIFPLDNYYKMNVFQKLKCKLISLQLFKKYYKEDNRHSKIIINILTFISNLLYKNKTSKELCTIKDRIYTKKNSKEAKYIINNSGAWGTKKETHLKEYYEDYKISKFENINAKIPVGYDEVLRKVYGDYMKLPPKEKRVTHHFTDKIDLKNSYTKYMEEKTK